ncbi:MAG TPA: CoA-binding protein [Verrucomicrobiae bacterium]|nr:CoA-binding protein [Verrucomicrobiae bacterium]
MTNPQQVLETARTILLVDWPSPAVPRALLEAGFTVFSYSPGRYSKAEIAPSPPSDVDSGGVFPPKEQSEKGYLVFRRLGGQPSSADLVSVYRSAEEMPGIIADHVLPLRARVIWLQRPVSSEDRTLAEKHGLVLIEGCDIAELARTLPRSQ